MNSQTISHDHTATTPGSDVQFDMDLIRRYDCNGPRYTSYPTAVEFTPECNTQTYLLAAARSNQVIDAGASNTVSVNASATINISDSNTRHTPLSIYLHIPFCTSPCFYCGCNKVITRDHSRADMYLAHLFKEMSLHANLLDRTRVVEQLHLGGGTPTFLSLDQLQQLMEKLNEHFNMSTDRNRREFSIEIDPRTLTPETLPTLAALGFNRLSLGVQDFDPRVQDAVNRVQSREDTLAAIEQARALGFRSVSVDLIYGLPLQTTDSFAHTLHSVIAARPNRIAVYGYAHMPRMFKAQRQINEAQLPSAAERLALLQLTIETLTHAGYVYIGMDHFALPDDELVTAQRNRGLHRNFQGYSTRAECDLIGLGVSAIGKVAGMYAQNARTLGEYYAALDHDELPIQRGLLMSSDDRIRHVVIQEIMCHGELDFAALSTQLGIDFEAYFADELLALTPLEDDGLLRFIPASASHGRGVRSTPAGRLLLRHIAMVFDAYLGNKQLQTFSKAI